MIPAKLASNPLLEFWAETRLRLAEAVEAPRALSIRGPLPRALPWVEVLAWLLQEGCGASRSLEMHAGSWCRSRRRNTPSAGGLYPFEAAALIAGKGCFRHDFDSGVLAPLAGTAAPEPHHLAGLGIEASSGHRPEALVVLLARPWLSVRKYGQRGHVYCHLDIGHAATNLWLLAKAAGWEPAVHLRFRRRAVAALLGLEGRCREPLAVLGFARRPVRRGAQGGREAVVTFPVETSWSLPSARERKSWRSLEGPRQSAASASPVPRAPGQRRPAVPADVVASPAVALPEPPSGRGSPRALAAVVGSRRSARGFLPEPLSLARVSAWLAAIRQPGPSLDLSPARPVLGVRLIARRVQGLAGIFAYCPDHHTLSGPIGEPFEKLDFQPACMGQEVVEKAALLLLLHAPIRSLLLSGGSTAFAELHFQAACLAQHLYLAATALGFAVTCIGGFDEELCSRLGGLEGEEETIYVVAAGIADARRSKVDRLRVAYSHGRRAEWTEELGHAR